LELLLLNTRCLRHRTLYPVAKATGFTVLFDKLFMKMNQFEIEEFHADWHNKAYRRSFDFLRNARRNGVIIWADGTNGIYWVCVDIRRDKRWPDIYASEQTIPFATRIGARSFCARLGLDIYCDQGNLELARNLDMRAARGDADAIQIKQYDYDNWLNRLSCWDWVAHHGDWQQTDN